MKITAAQFATKSRCVDVAQPIVQLRDVRLRFDHHAVLDGISLKVAPRERLVILGPSGTGKSTLLRVVIGTLRPDSGSVYIKGRDIARISLRTLNQLRTKIGMVFQYSALISSITVRENIALPLEELTTKSQCEINKIVDQKLEFIGLPGTKHLLPSELSGGMRKRIAIARALALVPDLILFDEPTAGLDPVAAAVVDQLILGLRDNGNATCIIVTHELSDAFRIAERMAMLYEGKIIEDASPEQFKRSKHPVVRRFLSGETHGPMTDQRAA
ncbi:MAG: ATP-binding cassette domain-containing protein [Candidatus Udaeobacter sp.]